MRCTHPLGARRSAWLLGALLALGACMDHTPTATLLDPSTLTPTANLEADVDPALGPLDEPGYAAAEAEGEAASMGVMASVPTIRIGVVPSANRIRIGGTEGFTVKSKVSGAVLFTGSGEDFDVLLESSAVTTRERWLQVLCSPNTAAGIAVRDDWLERATAKGYPNYTEYVTSANCWRLRVGVLPFPQNVALEAAFRTRVISDGLVFYNANGSLVNPVFVTVTMVAGTSQLKVVRGSYTTVLSTPVVLLPASGLVRIAGERYRGIAEVGFNQAQELAGINQLPLEEYLYGVVPRELPPVPYGLPEAQKAQAVAARNYALTNLGKRRADGYDLLPTSSDQVYGGYGAEHPIATAAVEATRGVVAVHDGRLISALYSSTSGGYTANSEDVFSSEVPYLRGVPDAERGQALDYVPTLEVFKRHANPTNLRAHAEGDFESDWSRYHRWTVDWTSAEMAEVLRASFGNPSITEVYSIKVTDRADQGRVLRIEFVTNAGTLSEVRDQIRSKLRYIALDSRGQRVHSSLRSTLFFIEPVTDPSTKAIIGWKAYGGGWGHGVGMSQTGAVGMAERGRTYEQILKHYYQGISLAQWY